MDDLHSLLQELQELVNGLTEKNGRTDDADYFRRCIAREADYNEKLVSLIKTALQLHVTGMDDMAWQLVQAAGQLANCLHARTVVLLDCVSIPQ